MHIPGAKELNKLSLLPGLSLGRSTKHFTQFEFSRPSGGISRPSGPSDGALACFSSKFCELLPELFPNFFPKCLVRFEPAIGRAHTTGENGEWGETKQHSENQVACKKKCLIIAPEIPPKHPCFIITKGLEPRTTCLKSGRSFLQKCLRNAPTISLLSSKQ
jgi:hypothetical protein